MIQKKREEYQNVEGVGRPFEMNPRYPIEKNDAERQTPVVVHLGDLNGQEGGKGMPKNFMRRKGVSFFPTRSIGALKKRRPSRKLLSTLNDHGLQHHSRPRTTEDR